MHGNAEGSHQVINTQEEHSLHLAKKIKAQADKKTVNQETNQAAGSCFRGVISFSWMPVNVFSLGEE